jgi:hypothetical protein
MIKKIATVTLISLVCASFQVHAVDLNSAQESENKMVVFSEKLAEFNEVYSSPEQNNENNFSFEESTQVVFMDDAEMAEVTGAVKFKPFVKVKRFFKNVASNAVKFARELNERINDSNLIGN